MMRKTVFITNSAQSTCSVYVKNLANGVYTLLLQNAAGVLNKKVVIQK